jgi:hypothetical protein
MTDYSPNAVARWMDGLGRGAFEAYREHAGGVAVNGQAIPEWDRVGEEVRSHWTHAAMTVIAQHVKAVQASDVSRETSTEGDPDGA